MINWFGKSGRPPRDGAAPPPPPLPGIAAAPLFSDPGDDRTIIIRASPPTLIAGGPRPAPAANAFDAPTMLARPGADFSAATIVSGWGVAAAPGLVDAPLPAGTVLNQRYEVIKPIGRGGFSYVYLCQHVRNGRLNAVKEAYFAGCGRAGASVIGGAGLPQAKDALLREVSAISRLNHPGVVRFEDVFEANGTLCFAMDFVEGEPLSVLLGRRRGISAATFGPVAERLLEAVEALHAADVLHGDIKPANIIVRQDKSLVLIDFGTAARLSDMHYSEAIITPGFSPPERYQANGEVGAWSDVYSCAATLGAAMAGAPPPDSRQVAGAGEAMAAFLATAGHRMPDQARWLAGLARGLSVGIEERTSSIGELRAAMGIEQKAVQASAPEGARNDGSSVFVSYSHKDGDAVEGYVRAIQRLGGGVWIDRKGIPPGSRAWGAEILNGMRGAQAVLLFSSANSMASENVKEEIYLAKELKKPIVVARLDEAPFSDDVMLFLTRTQHIAVAQMPPAEFGAAVIQALDSQQARAA